MEEQRWRLHVEKASGSGDAAIGVSVNTISCRRAQELAEQSSYNI